MNNNNWNILEKLADPSTDSTERKRLLKVVESDTDLLDQWKAFRVLQQWPQLENQNSMLMDTSDIMLRIRQENSLDAGIKRTFPYVAAAALAASLILAFVNIGQSDKSSDITLDDVFGLPSPTIENSLLVNL